MTILVFDTPILIELERGGLLEAAFSCGLTIVVPDLMYNNHLERENGPYLRSLGLGVLALAPDEMAKVQMVQTERQPLTLPHCFALVCACRPNHILIANDTNLLKEANKRLGTGYGLLWFLDQMASSEKVSKALLHGGLTQIAGDTRCRLPQTEVKARLAEWTHHSGHYQRPDFKIPL